MTDTEKDALLQRIKQLEQVNEELNLIARRWRHLCMAGTVVLFLIFLLTAGVMMTREQDLRKEADNLRIKLEGRKEQRELPRTGPSALGGQDIE